jgi:hypothetical protein
MADSDVLIQPLVLDPADFPPLPLQPGFLELVSDELRDSATPADGFDDVVGELIAIVDALDAGLLALNPTLGDTFAEADTIDAQPVSDTVDGFGPALDPTSSAVDDLGTLLSSVAAPAPPAGGGAPSVTIINLGQFSPGQGVLQFPITYTNKGAAAVTVKGITFTPLTTSADPTAWQFPALTFPIVVQPGASTQFTVGVDSTVEGQDFAEMVVDADATPPAGDYRLVIIFSSSGGQPPPGPGGGGGTGKEL